MLIVTKFHTLSRVIYFPIVMCLLTATRDYACGLLTPTSHMPLKFEVDEIPFKIIKFLIFSVYTLVMLLGMKDTVNC